MIEQKIRKQELEEILNQIIIKLEENYQEIPGLGLKYGKTGASLLYYSYYLYTSDETFLSKSKAYLYKGLESLNNGYLSPSIYREIAEFGWCLNHFQDQIDFVKVEDLMSDLDNILKGAMISEMEKRNYDPITGVLSYGYYFLKRSEKTESDGNIIIKQIVKFLFDCSSKDSYGRFWKSQLKKEENIYFGITHGISNIILFLIYAEQSGIIKADEQLQVYIGESCNYIMGHLYEENHPQIFPILKHESKSKEIYSKNYCYGDYSTLFGLYKGFEWLKDEAGQKKTLALFHQCFKKGHNEPYLQGGCSIIYGHSGLSMIFRDLYHTSNKMFFKQAQEYFIIKILDAFDPKDEKYLGFRGYWNQDLENINFSLAEGMTGIALELIAYLSNGKIKDHDQFFFITNPNNR